MCKERSLKRNPTNFFIVSLAVADFLVGSLVMPFNEIYEVTTVWMFGSDWCDIWHSFDVLASTSSIVNLCLISLDRYWAITNPMSYPSKMTRRKATYLILAGWVYSCLISFPAILFWRFRSSPANRALLGLNQCPFTDDPVYIIASSIISFYAPCAIIGFCYYKIYQAASDQVKSIRTGIMHIHNVRGEQDLTLRVHKGGYCRSDSVANAEETKRDAYKRRRRQGKQLFLALDTPPGQPEKDEMNALSELPSPSYFQKHIERNSSAKNRLKPSAVTKRVSRFALEKKAAKTLGIVVTVFIACWLGFFVCNVLNGVCSVCILKPEITMSVFTWLGFINSGELAYLWTEEVDLDEP